VIEHVATELRHIKVRETVVVIVSPYAAQPVPRTQHASLVGNVGERASDVFPVERIPNNDAAVIQIAPIYEVDVLPTVAIKVRHADPRSELLAIDGNSLIALEVYELDAGWGGNVGKLRGPLILCDQLCGSDYHPNRESTQNTDFCPKSLNGAPSHARRRLTHNRADIFFPFCRQAGW